MAMKQTQAQKQKVVKSIIEGLSKVDFVSFDKDLTKEIPTEPIWSYIAQYETSFDSSLPVEKTSEVKDWLTKLSESLRISNQCQLSLGGYGLLPWVRVRFDNDNISEAVYEIWSSLKSKDFLVLNIETDELLGIIEEEYFYGAIILKDLSKFGIKEKT